MKALAFERPASNPVRFREATEQVEPLALNLPVKFAETLHMGAFITVADAAGRVLFRRPATDAEVLSAIHAAEVAEAESQAVMERLAEERSEPDFGFETDEAPPR